MFVLYYDSYLLHFMTKFSVLLKYVDVELHCNNVDYLIIYCSDCNKTVSERLLCSGRFFGGFIFKSELSKRHCSLLFVTLY